MCKFGSWIFGLSQRYPVEVFGTGPLLVSLRIDAEDNCGNGLKLEKTLSRLCLNNYVPRIKARSY